nr:hypothetical protein 6 [Moraxellaceae bacterium]
MSERDGKRMAVIGKTGSGKSVYVQKLIAEMDRLVIFDPKRSYRKEAKKLRAYVAQDLGDLLETLRDNADKSFRVIYEPTPTREEQELSDVCMVLEMLQRPYLDGKANAKVTLVVEELHQGNPNPPSREFVGFARCIQMGRESGINVIGVTQRPQSVSKYFRENIERMAVFQVAGVDAAKAAADMADGNNALERDVLDLRDYRFVLYENGNYKVCDPIPL